MVLTPAVSAPVCQAHTSTSVTPAWSSTLAFQAFRITLALQLFGSALVSNSTISTSVSHFPGSVWPLYQSSTMAPPFVGFTMDLLPVMALGHPPAPSVSTLAPSTYISTLVLQVIVAIVVFLFLLLPPGLLSSERMHLV